MVWLDPFRSVVEREDQVGAFAADVEQDDLGLDGARQVDHHEQQHGQQWQHDGKFQGGDAARGTPRQSERVAVHHRPPKLSLRMVAATTLDDLPSL